MAKSKTLNVNGKPASVKYDDPQMPLLYALRDDLGLHGPRFGCGLGQCGACTVHIDGVAVRSCITPLATVEAKQKIVTLEGLARGTKLCIFDVGVSRFLVLCQQVSRLHHHIPLMQ